MQKEFLLPLAKSDSFSLAVYVGEFYCERGPSGNSIAEGLFTVKLWRLVMKLVKVLFLALSLALGFSVEASAYEVSDRIYISERDLIESDEGHLFVQFDEAMFAVDELWSDADNDLYIIEAGVEPGVPGEMVYKCPCCGRLQTNLLLAKNKWRCSRCKLSVWTCK